MYFRYICILLFIIFVTAKANVTVSFQDKHSDGISFIAMSNDSSLLATVSKDKAIYLWNMKNGNFIKKLNDYGGDGKIVLNKKKNILISTSLNSKNVVLWNLEKGIKGKVLFHDIEQLHAITLSSDGSRLFFLNNNYIYIYDLNKDVLILSKKVFAKQKNTSRTNIFLDSKNQRFILQIGSQIKMMEIKEGKLSVLYSRHNFISLFGFNKIYNLTVSNDFKYIAVANATIGSNSDIVIINLKEMKRIRILHKISQPLVSDIQFLIEKNKKELVFSLSIDASLNGKKGIESYSIYTGQRVNKIDNTGFKKITSNNKYYIDTYKSSLKMKSLKTGDTIIDFYPKNNYINNLIVKNSVIYALTNNKIVKKIDLKNLKIFPSNMKNKIYSTSTSIGNKFIAYELNNKIVIINSESDEKVREIENPKEDTIQNIFLLDENILSLGYKRYTLIYNIKLNKVISYVNIPNPIEMYKVDNTLLVSSKSNLYIFNFSSMELKSKIYIAHVSEGEEVFDLSHKGIISLPSRDKILLCDYRKNKILYGLHHGHSYSNKIRSSFSKDGNYIAYETSEYEIKIWDIEKRQLVKTLKNHTANITSLTYTEDDRYLISSSKDGSTIIYDGKSYQELAKFMLFDNEWIMLTPEGYFTGSQKAAKYLLIRIGGLEVSDMRQFYDHFFRPDLVKLKLSGDEEAYQKATNGLTYQDALKNPPPKLAFETIGDKKVEVSGFEYKESNSSTDKTKLTFNIKEHDGGGIGLIRIYQEGKLIQTIGEGQVNKQSANVNAVLEQEKLDTKQKEVQKEYIALNSKGLEGNLSIEETIAPVRVVTTTNKEGTYSVDLDLIAGVNEISIEAFNKTNTVTSYRENITINANIPKKEAKLYAIVAGVNNFESDEKRDKKKLQLKYSQKDAQDIKKAIESKTGKLYSEIEVIYLEGNEVTKDNILKASQEISKKAKLEDTVLFYISTHGRAIKGKLYLVPYNNKSAKNWIDFEQTFQAIQSIKALNQIFILDTCESGKANDIVSSVYDSRASVLAKSSGVHMLLATTKGTFAFESTDPKVKNGVFTHKILQALKDTTVDSDKDGTISILELSKKLKEPSNNTEYQYPVIRNVGSDVGVRRVGE